MLLSMDHHIVQLGCGHHKEHHTLKEKVVRPAYLWCSTTESRFVSLRKQMLCAQVTKAATHWQSVTRFLEFSASRKSRSAPLTHQSYFSEWTLIFATMEEKQTRGKFYADPLFQIWVDSWLLHFAPCTSHTGTGGLALLVQPHSTGDLHKYVLRAIG